MLSPVTHRQFEQLRGRYPAATLQELPSSAALVIIPGVKLPPGWSSPTTSIYFIVPAGYPGPTPDCFWADQGLVLVNGAAPQASQSPNAIPETNIQGRWFSWHVTGGQQNWHPNRDDLMTYVRIVLDRFRAAQ